MRAVIFDWDGTLVDTLPAILQANVEVLREYGVRFDEAVYRSAYVPDWRHMYRRLGVPEAALGAAGARWLELYLGAGGLAPFDGIGEALQALSRAGHRMGLVTAGDRAVVEDQLTRFGLAKLLPLRVCGDDALPPKPDPEPLRHALSALDAGGFAERAIYVGDAPDDMRMARAAGVIGVGVIGPLASADDLLAAGAAETAGSVVEWVAAYLAARVEPERR
jgi:phosphoglycolate phosphatase-like HAD superfamily hydrolase